VTRLTVQRFASRAALDAALEQRLGQAIAARGPSAIMLSGGTTPLPSYRALARRPLPHDEGLRLLFSDERYVPSDADASNYHQSRALIDALRLPPTGILRVRTELPLEEAAADYERSLAALLAGGVRHGLALLGLGAEGHTASLFVAADLARAAGHLAIAVQRPDGMSAVSATPQLLAQFAEPVFVVAGTSKRDAVRRLLAHDLGLTAWAAVQVCASVELWVDQSADPGAPA
jgi:6-phosphogluconolactonase